MRTLSKQLFTECRAHGTQQTTNAVSSDDGRATGGVWGPRGRALPGAAVCRMSSWAFAECFFPSTRQRCYSPSVALSPSVFRPTLGKYDVHGVPDGKHSAKNLALGNFGFSRSAPSTATLLWASGFVFLDAALDGCWWDVEIGILFVCFSSIHILVFIPNPNLRFHVTSVKFGLTIPFNSWYVFHVSNFDLCIPICWVSAKYMNHGNR